MVRIALTPRMILVGLVALAAALGLLSASVGAAPPQQEPYPPPVCPCVVTVSVGEVATSAGDCIPITCKASDTEGAPVVNLECTMSVISQPGTDATVTPRSVTTDENGEATAELCVGSTAGPIVVLAETECCGSKGQVQVTAQPPTTALPEFTPPAALPPTGVGTGDGNSWFAPLTAIWSAMALAAGAVLVWRIGGRRRRSS